MKKLVVENNNRHLYVMEESGKISRMPARNGVKVGDIIECGTIRPIFMNPAFYRIAAVLMLVIGITCFPLMQAFASDPGYLVVDINPSVQLTFKNANHVASVEGLNEDGVKLLEGLDLKNISPDEAINAILAKAKDEGYIKTSDSTSTTGTPSVYITVASKRSSLSDSLKEAAEEAASDFEDSVGFKSVIVEPIPIERQKEAAELGVSPGKMLLAQRLAELDSTIEAKDVVNDTVQSIMKRIIALHKEEKAAEKASDDTQKFLDKLDKAAEKQEKHANKTGDDESSSSVSSSSSSSSSTSSQESTSESISSKSKSNGQKNKNSSSSESSESSESESSLKNSKRNSNAVSNDKK